MRLRNGYSALTGLNEKFRVRINPGLQPGLMYFALSALENNK